MGRIDLKGYIDKGKLKWQKMNVDGLPTKNLKGSDGAEYDIFHESGKPIPDNAQIKPLLDDNGDPITDLDGNCVVCVEIPGTTPSPVRTGFLELNQNTASFNSPIYASLAQPHFEYHPKNITFAYTATSAPRKDCNGQKHPAKKKGLNIWERIKGILQARGWTKADIDRFENDLKTDADLLKKFESGEIDYEASLALVLDEVGSGNSGKILRRILGAEKTVTRLKGILAGDPDLSMEDIKGLIKNAQNKKDILSQLEDYDASNIDKLKELIKQKGLKLPLANPKIPNLPFRGTPSSKVMNEVAKRQKASLDADNLDINSPTYDADYKKHMKEMRDASEKSAELMADIHFGKGNEIDLSIGGGKQGQFDRVYKTPDGTWHVVECKGGASELGSRGGNQQCTKLYIDSIIANLGSKLTGQKKIDLEELKKALEDGKVKNYSLKQPFNTDGSLGVTKLTEYNL